MDSSRAANCQHHFYPRSPCGERLDRWLAGLKGTLFLSTLSLRRATPRGGSCYLDNIISIHALLAESDYDTSSLMQCQAKFLSTLSLRRATKIRFLFRLPKKFLSTLSLRRATALRQLQFALRRNFYPRSPCGERLRVLDGSKSSIEISIHALLAESDPRRLETHQ